MITVQLVTSSKATHETAVLVSKVYSSNNSLDWVIQLECLGTYGHFHKELKGRHFVGIDSDDLNLLLFHKRQKTVSQPVLQLSAAASGELSRTIESFHAVRPFITLR